MVFSVFLHLFLSWIYSLSAVSNGGIEVSISDICLKPSIIANWLHVLILFIISTQFFAICLAMASILSRSMSNS